MLKKLLGLLAALATVLATLPAHASVAPDELVRRISTEVLDAVKADPHPLLGAELAGQPDLTGEVLAASRARRTALARRQSTAGCSAAASRAPSPPSPSSSLLAGAAPNVPASRREMASARSARDAAYR